LWLVVGGQILQLLIAVDAIGCLSAKGGLPICACWALRLLNVRRKLNLYGAWPDLKLATRYAHLVPAAFEDEIGRFLGIEGRRWEMQA
jgi:hypothetical protein